uniref:Uncharacterized protein n=1 Tax=Oryza punctata TaxID=4537 RepID=A0A0E0JF75_ORYPU
MDSPPHQLALLVLVLVLLLVVLAAVSLRGRCRCREGEAHQLPSLPEQAEAGAGEGEAGEEGGRERRRRRKARRRQRKGGDDDAADGEGERDGDEALQLQQLRRRPRFPLASVAGALQRRITARYDDLARASQAHSLTIHQVHEFINCLVDARNELLHKSETVQRSCRIKKALLSNPCSRRANSYDRLCEQVHKLEAEHKRLKKDADIYNYIQEQLQKSHSYKLLIELSALVEKANREDALAAEAAEMTFEELLAQEKSDAAFWQRHRKLTSISPK